ARFQAPTLCVSGQQDLHGPLEQVLPEIPDTLPEHASDLKAPRDEQHAAWCPHILHDDHSGLNGAQWQLAQLRTGAGCTDILTELLDEFRPEAGGPATERLYCLAPRNTL